MPSWLYFLNTLGASGPPPDMQMRMVRRLALSSTEPNIFLPGFTLKAFLTKPETDIRKPMRPLMSGPLALMPLRMPASTLLNNSGTPRNIVTLASLSSLRMALVTIRWPKTSSAPAEIASMKTASIVYEWWIGRRA